jgi:hypothetical protein
MRDPMFTSPLAAILASSTALMYVNLIFGGILLLEARLLYVLLPRRRLSRWPALAPLALAVFAFALAHQVWDVYAQGTSHPHFPPFFFDSFGGTNAGQPTIALFVMVALISLFVLAVHSGDYSVKP